MRITPWIVAVMAILCWSCNPVAPEASAEHPVIADARKLVATGQVLAPAARLVCQGDSKCLAPVESGEAILATTAGALRAYDSCKDDPSNGECLASALDEVQALLPRLKALITGGLKASGACVEPAASAAPLALLRWRAWQTSSYFVSSARQSPVLREYRCSARGTSSSTRTQTST